MGLYSQESPASHSGSSTGDKAIIFGSGEMADRVRKHDWTSTSLGPLDSWSNELIALVNLTLCSPTPARLLWTSEFILIYNDAYRELAGVRHPKALGRPAKEVWPEAWHIVGSQIETVFTTGTTGYYEKSPVPITKNGKILDSYLTYSYCPVYESGEIAGVYGSLLDVTAEVVTALQLIESDARASRILESIGDAVIVTDEQTCITQMNVVAETLTGWSTEEAMGQPLAAVFRIVNEETRLAVESPAEKVKRTGGIVGLANHTVLVSKDGTESHIDDSGAPIRDDQGTLTGIVLVFRDISERRSRRRARSSATGIAASIYRDEGDL